MNTETSWGPHNGGKRNGRRDTARNRALSGKPLSPRQVLVIELIADGTPTAKIGKVLGAAENTIKVYIANALRQTETRDRAHLVSWAYRNGVLATDAGTGLTYAEAVHMVRRYSVTGEGRRLREICGISAREVARVCGVAQDAVRAWERGVTPSTAYMVDYACVLRSLAGQGRLPENLA